MSFQTDMIIVLIFLVWQLLAALVQWDRSHIRWKDALYNVLVGPPFYLIIVPLYYILKTYLTIKYQVVMYFRRRACLRRGQAPDA